MMTAEIMFAQPGNRTIDHEYNARTILWAVLAALFIHLLLAYLLAVLGGVFAPAAPIEEKPIELTFTDLSPTSLVPKNSAFIETDESKKSVEPPEEKTFESNANSIAASELPASGQAPIAVADGKRSTNGGFGDSSVLASNEWGATAAQCRTTGEFEAFSPTAVDPATTASYRSGAICDVDRKTQSGALLPPLRPLQRKRDPHIGPTRNELGSRAGSQTAVSLPLMRWAHRLVVI